MDNFIQNAGRKEAGNMAELKDSHFLGWTSSAVSGVSVLSLVGDDLQQHAMLKMSIMIPFRRVK